MCGIAGLIARDGRSVPDGLAERMSATLSHRGPDACGAWGTPAVGFGHQRLSIIDLSVDGRQPMLDESGQVALVCNGEIYNHLELRERALARGHEFRSHSDSEVLVHRYEDLVDEPARLLDELDGMFAFAIYDRRRERLLLGRDRLGIKPLYYAVTEGYLLFASEPKALFASGLIEARPDPSSLVNYLAFRHPVSPASMFEGVHALEPGHYLLAEGGRVETHRYWDIPQPDPSEDLGVDEYAALTRAGLREAVRKRLMTDVPFGAYLSGGLDSSIVVALMAELSEEPVKTYSVGFGAPSDEFPYARMVADRYATDHHEIVLDAPRYFELLPELIRYRDAPLGVPNEVPLYEMSRVLKQDITVVLSGEGADELFGGYGDYARTPFDWRKGQLLRPLPTAARRLLHGGIEEKYGEHAYEADLGAHFLAGYHWFPPAELATLLAPSVINTAATAGRDRILRHFDHTRGWSAYDRVLYVLERVHLVNLLQRVDSMTMASAVEARVPFVDHQLVEFASGIPFQYKMRWRSPFHRARAWLSYSDRFRERDDTTKYILRRAFEDAVPSAILQRRKVGFKVPLEGSLAEDTLAYARGLLRGGQLEQSGLFDAEGLRAWLDRGAANGGEFGLRAWMLANLELWFRLYIEDAEIEDHDDLIKRGAAA